jgi:hypothetical protein
LAISFRDAALKSERITDYVVTWPARVKGVALGWCLRATPAISFARASTLSKAVGMQENMELFQVGDERAGGEEQAREGVAEVDIVRAEGEGLARTQASLSERREERAPARLGHRGVKEEHG